ncbi:hypothetical protein CHS0354_013536 [Potamilus streckersoni]|uniref:Tyrosinase copper-binding domain-containing protein n=1 Tax=Potamilus streckersoni TaxID=2493646 RepID=A0AAE0T9M7_9BIVA|nr:hypothetical protein CHS0354_013536 [Potamilus streckersoni]
MSANAFVLYKEVPKKCISVFLRSYTGYNMAKNNTIMVVLYVTLLFLTLPRHIVMQLEPTGLPPELQFCFEDAKNRTDLTRTPGEQIFWSCVQRFTYKITPHKERTINFNTETFLKGLLDPSLEPLLKGFRVKRQAGVRVRKEIRMLTDSERNDFFRAVNMLKNDKSLEPNVYDNFTDFHLMNIPRSHFGPAFVAWHRVYLYMFETLLRTKVPGVTLPYWASALDREMHDPTQSVLWADEFLGNGFGEPITGPFSNWTKINPIQYFERQIGASGELFSYDGLQRVLSKQRNEQILQPSAPFGDSLEDQHGAVHQWIGGSMRNLVSAPHDPVFFLHHAFVDLIWESFRIRQFQSNLDPTRDYPWDRNNGRLPSEHAPESDMGFSFVRVSNIQGFGTGFSNLVQYDPIPSCTALRPWCGSRFLRCDTNTTRPRCVSRAISDVPGLTNYINILSGMGRPDREMCSIPETDRPAHNNFAINGVVDVNNWVYIPIRIISKRPSSFRRFNYLKSSGQQSATSIPELNQAVYKDCKIEDTVAGKIKVVSIGLNYIGQHEEFAIVDNRQEIALSSITIAVRKPEYQQTETLVSAFDKCGRVCRPFYSRTDKGDDEPFSGAILLTLSRTVHYQNSAFESIKNAWTVGSDDACPVFNIKSPYITFYCDYGDIWPWKIYKNDSGVSKMSIPTRFQNVENQVNLDEMGQLAVLKERKDVLSTVQIDTAKANTEDSSTSYVQTLAAPDKPNPCNNLYSTSSEDMALCKKQIQETLQIKT